jgi:hypothetical protein
MHKLEKPLYHGTSSASSIYIVGGIGFKAPVYLCDDKSRAEHYAKAATAYVESLAKEKRIKLIADGYAIFTFHSLPNKDFLIEDGYNPEAERGQFIYTQPIRGLQHFTVERHSLEVDEDERLRLRCFAIGMWGK